jgi:D-3-phosphoglycerate dehydrogenase
MKVLIANKFERSGVDGLAALGCEVDYQPDLSGPALADLIAARQIEILVVRSTTVTEAMMAPTLRLIVRAGAGVNTIDVPAATARRIAVANCPGKNAIAVAELAFGLILALDRRIPDAVADLRAGRWNKKEYAVARGLHGSVLGLLGAGSIAREMIVRAAAFGLPVVLWSRRFAGQDRRLTPAETDALGLAGVHADISLAPSPAAVAKLARILSIHLALAPETRGIVNAAVLAELAPGSLVINTARAEVVDYDALRRAVRECGVRVGLDVFPGEPTSATGPFTDPIVAEPGVYGTHHIGASTDQAQEAIAAETVRIVRVFRETGRAPNSVNS